MTVPPAPLTPSESDAPLTTKGAAPNEKGQRKWWDDVDILARVRRVHSLTAQGLFSPKIATLLKVSEGTVHQDRARYLELAREEIVQDVKDHIADLGRVIEEAYAAFHALGATNTFAIKRSDYLNIIRQARMDIAKLDGSLNAEQQLAVGIQINMGPAPNELYRQGKMTDADYEAHLRVLALQSGADVIEGEVLSPAAEAESPVATTRANESVVASPRRRVTSPPPSPAGVAQAAPATPLVEDPMLADFVPDPPRDDEDEDEDE